MGKPFIKKDPEEREDCGTSPFLQAIRIALSMKLKEKMGTDNMHRREEEINKQVFEELCSIDNAKIISRK